ncbi:hypothetical protein IGI52_002941 [Enterococcus sp. DIV0187]
MNGEDFKTVVSAVLKFFVYKNEKVGVIGLNRRA